MKYWRLNTDSENDRTCDVWYKYNLAFTGDYQKNELKHAVVMDKLSPGDGIFMHHNGLGITGYGIVRERWDGKSYNGRDKLLYIDGQRNEYFEYRMPVECETACDCRTAPLPIHGRLPYRGAYCEVNPENGWDVAHIIQELRNRVASFRVSQ